MTRPTSLSRVGEDIGTIDVSGKLLQHFEERVAHIHGPISFALGVPDDDFAFIEADVWPD